MQSSERMFTVDKFLGINQAEDGSTELKMGEASDMVNFTITDGLNLALRPGVNRVNFGQDREPAPILASWAGHITEEAVEEHLVVVDFVGGTDRIWLYSRPVSGGEISQYRQDGALGLTSMENHYVKIFAFGGRLWIMSREKTVVYREGSWQEEKPYVPLVIAGAPPAGGGTTIENINLLTVLRRINYSADGESKAFVLPSECQSVEKLKIDGVEQNISQMGTFSPETKTFTFNTAPIKGVGNVEFTYAGFSADAEKDRLTILQMPLIEAYNGSTDTRLFVGGVGNVCYYTGVTESGEATPMYFPALYSVSVDMTGASVTGMVRHYSKLLVFTRDGTYTFSYEPVTLSDGTTTAGFYLRSANREFGNDVLGQVQTVNNYPRTITQDGIYEWRITSSYYQDERYAKRVSDPVQRTLKNADIQKIVTCDDNFEKTYYLFLNDEEGTVLVNRYDVTKDGVWCVYRSKLFRNVTHAFVFNGVVHFATETEVFAFGEGLTMDAPELPDGEAMSIQAVWESGFMHFDADFRRKFSSEIYVSMKPESHSEMVITAQTDRRSEYMEKTVSNNIFMYSKMDYRYFTYNTNNVPKIQRIRLKVKKFVYYKLIFRVESPGASATVLSYDQKVRYGSMAK